MNLYNQTWILNQTFHSFIKPRLIHTDKIIIYSILFVLSSVGNTTSLIALINMNKRKSLNCSKSRIRLLFINLCIGDLMVNEKNF
jgi:hypothetical protein